MTNERTSLVAWWERSCLQRRQETVPNVPLPWDGAGHHVMANFFAVVGFGDVRRGTEKQLSAMLWFAKPDIMQRFLDLWPIKKATVDVDNTQP